jgi:hypothetical protein
MVGIGRRRLRSGRLCHAWRYPLAEKLIQPPAFSKYFTVNALTTENTESTEEDLEHLRFVVFSVGSVVNAMDDGN